VDPLPPELRAVVWDLTDQHTPEGQRDLQLDDLELVVLPYMAAIGDVDVLRRLPRLRVVQTLTAGYEDVLDFLPDGVAMATAAGVHDASTAELALGLMLASLRGIPEAVRDAEEGRWQPQRRISLADRRVLVIGVGGVGGAIAERLAPFEVSLSRVASRARDDDRGTVHAATELQRLLPDHDVVVLACPLNEHTRGMVDAAFLAAMPDGALLVNVGRGGLVDTDALLAELRSARLQAALDVVDPEPLPVDHPLWSAPGLLLTPHLGGNTTAFAPRAAAMLRDQLARFAANEPLQGVVVEGNRG
jgi:phosphoglycerate dehydrogenase-like enzyme